MGNKKKDTIYKDSSSVCIYNNSEIKKDSMQGKTPYGMKIREIKREILKDNFHVEIIYSKILSDDHVNKYIMRFYKEFFQQVRDWVYLNKVQKDRVKIIISNCRFNKTGYCKKLKKKRVSLISCKNNKKDKEYIFYHVEIMKGQNHISIAKKAVKALFGK
ncbi:hypothetical protein ACFL20_01720 [Spirochaetota bacterium]